VLLDPAVYIPNVPVTADQSFNNWSPEATLTWRPQDNLTLYGAYKTGYKSGGFSNSSIYSATTAPGGLAFQPEKASGFEAGVKSTLLDNQLLLNLTVYHYKFTDLQIDFYNAANISYVTTNAGGAKTDGVEIESVWAPRSIRGLNLTGGLNYNKARYTDFTGPCWGGQTAPEGCDLQGPGGAPYQDLAGRPTANAPLWSASLGADYNFPISASLLGGVSVNGRYISSSNASAFFEPLAEEGGYLTLDGSVRLGTDNGRWQAALIGKNLTNQFHFNAVYDISGTGSGTGSPQAHGVEADQIASVGMPRTVELQVSWRY
jgi:iron complex outermembrane receptor protein